MTRSLSSLTASILLCLGTLPAQAAGPNFIGNVIVDGSLCVGNDCVVGQAFGFDTIILKENNLRVFFDDTSVAASFPSNDWRLVANGSANGGPNRFAIEDATAGRNLFVVTAGARNNALFVDSQGDVGIGTNAPATDIHIRIGDTPTLRLEQDGSSGFTPQTWDLAGNEAGFFVRDATNGSTLPFRIRPGAASQSLVIDNDNNVGIGILNATNSLHIRRSDGTASMLIQEANATVVERTLLTMENTGGSRIDWINLDTGTSWKMNTNNSDQFVISEIGVTNPGKFILENNAGDIEVGLGRIPQHPLHHSSGARLTAGGVWTNASSRSLKSEIRALDADEAMTAVNQLEPVTYRYDNEDGERYVGFIAEDVPELVAQSDRASLSPMDMVAVLTKVVQQQNALLTEQQALNRNLIQRIERLETDTE